MVFIFQNKMQIRFINFSGHILLKWCFFFPFFSLPTQWLYHIFLSFADHRQVRLCLLQNGLRHRITLYPPSRKVSFLFCFAFCVYVHVFSRPYAWSQYSWTLGSHLAGWRALETKRRLFFVNVSSDIPKRSVLGSKMWWFEWSGDDAELTYQVTSSGVFWAYPIMKHNTR